MLTVCHGCGIIFQCRPQRLRIGWGKYCSHSCAQKTHTGEKASRWKGGLPLNYKSGYVSVYAPNHPLAHHGRILEHILVSERMLGYPLPDGYEVHHRDFNRKNNNPENLIICRNHAEHAKFHEKRGRAQCHQSV